MAYLKTDLYTCRRLVLPKSRPRYINFTVIIPSLPSYSPPVISPLLNIRTGKSSSSWTFLLHWEIYIKIYHIYLDSPMNLQYICMSFWHSNLPYFKKYTSIYMISYIPYSIAGMSFIGRYTNDQKLLYLQSNNTVSSGGGGGGGGKRRFLYL